MPTNRAKTNPTKPWHARTSVNKVVYSLGYFTTEQEAQNAEYEFRQQNGLKARIPNQARYDQIIKLRGQGLTDGEIASEMDVSYATIRSITSVYNRRNANAH